MAIHPKKLGVLSLFGFLAKINLAAIWHIGYPPKETHGFGFVWLVREIILAATWHGLVALRPKKLAFQLFLVLHERNLDCSIVALNSDQSIKVQLTCYSLASYV